MTSIHLSRLIPVVFTGILLSACTNEVALLDQTQAKGDAFSAHLADEYRQFAKYEAYEMIDWTDAEHFAAKGLAAAQGKHVKPEDPALWSTPPAKLGEMKISHKRLAAILETGVKAGDPRTAATAQARYDCWVEQQEENWQGDHIAACKAAFHKALEKLEASPEVQAARFTMVLFPFDSANIVRNELETLAELIGMAQGFGFSAIEVAGHTDRRGPATYNEQLSRSRAEAVRLALSLEGIMPALIKVSAHGENQPRVPTADGVDEPLNRRVEIWLRKPVQTSSRPQIETAAIH